MKYKLEITFDVPDDEDYDEDDLALVTLSAYVQVEDPENLTTENVHMRLFREEGRIPNWELVSTVSSI